MRHEEIVEHPERAGQLSAEELAELLEECTRLFEGERQLLEAEGRVLVVGDTHGDQLSTLKAFKVDADAYVFLGDYVDRGPQQLENINFLLAKKLSEPERVLLIRGNHESPLMNYSYGFYTRVVTAYGAEIYKMYARLFAQMPYAVLINSSVLAVHGGIARGLKSLDDLRRLPKGDLIPSNQLAFEVLWNDPDESVKWFAPSPRGEGVYLFGRSALKSFMDANDVKLIVRGHEYFPTGLYTYFEGMLVSVFSCRYYPSTSPKAVLVRDHRWEPLLLD